MDAQEATSRICPGDALASETDRLVRAKLIQLTAIPVMDTVNVAASIAHALRTFAIQLLARAS